MRVSLKRLLLFAGVVAFARTAAATSPAVTLLAPRASDVLDGGREATITWSAASLPAHTEEWEAFLSVDGGVFYAVRITPHLDAHTRTFRWRVPNVAASHARLLLRVGDETTEHLIELPQTFSIVPRYSPLEIDALQVATADEAGEAAVAGGSPSVEWVSSDLVRHRHGDAAASGAPAFAAVLPFDAIAVNSSDTSLPIDRTSLAIPPTRRARPPSAACGALRPLLLLSTRLNV